MAGRRMGALAAVARLVAYARRRLLRRARRRRIPEIGRRPPFARRTLAARAVSCRGVDQFALVDQGGATTGARGGRRLARPNAFRARTATFRRHRRRRGRDEPAAVVASSNRRADARSRLTRAGG